MRNTTVGIIALACIGTVNAQTEVSIKNSNLLIKLLEYVLFTNIEVKKINQDVSFYRDQDFFRDF